ncbi:eukaryotic translation initiation factor 3 subunit I isoform X1 [Cynoglossus semilaevis]|uniref:eukaryotic translation initiation factor 3 subunit I isoform X1 n=1 Tax=Cynoglossus semilaevis TaxID=244447 RepID=UPI000D6305BC|nr:eukaryotic translation initiation factor 3 subunit I-like isoform X1 [Cynoglossus semilaevis]
MKPILLQDHGRSITQIKYNGEGDLFSVAKDPSGEVLKKAKEHNRHIDDIQMSVALTMFISASKDNTAKVLPSSVRGGVWQESKVILVSSTVWLSTMTARVHSIHWCLTAIVLSL